MSVAPRSAGPEPPSPTGGLDLDSLLRELPAIVFVAEVGPQGAWLYVSPQIEAIVGLTPEEWLSHEAPFGTFVHPADLEEITAIEGGLVAKRNLSPFELEFRMIRPDGRTVWLQERARLVERDGALVVQGMFLDVTQWREAELRLAEANRHWSALVEASPLAVMTWDGEGRILTWNPAAERIFGWTEEEAVGRFLPQVQPEAKEQMLEFIRHGFSGETWTEIELRRQRKDGSYIDVQISSAGLRNERGEITSMMSVIADITERKRAEELFRAQELELRQREQLDAIGKLAGGIAHDFNNLLTAIHGQALLALDELAGDPRAANVEPIVDAAERAGALTRQLLAFGRRQVLEPRLLSVNDVVESIEPLLRRLAGDAIALNTKLERSVPAVEADPTQLDQVLVNLISNARDAMPRGGSIEIESRLAEIEEDGNCRRYTVLSVGDTGHGMDETVRARVFEPFFTTKALGRGSGLGLSTVYGIVAQSGGFVEVETDIGRGSTFSVFLPAVDREAEQAAPAVSAPGRAADLAASILLVEDEPLVRNLIERVLRGEGYQISVAGSASEALAAYDPRAFDLLLSDVVMPGMSGPELAAHMRTSNPGLAVLLISGYNETAVAGYGVREQTVELLQKPFTPATLSARVQGVLARH